MPRPSSYVIPRTPRTRTIYYPPVRPVRYYRNSSYTALGGFGSDDSAACGCEVPGSYMSAGAFGNIESMIKAHPVLWVAGAFLLGYSLKGR